MAIVEDDPISADLLFQTSRHFGFEPLVMECGEQVNLAFEAAGGECPWDVMVLDLGLPDCDGHEVLKRVRDRFPRLPCVVLTARDCADDAVRAMKGGAVDYVVKPFDPEGFFEKVTRLVDGSASEESGLCHDGFAWASPSMLRVAELFRQASGSRRPVFIEGEAGTGKSRLAMQLHEAAGGGPDSWLELDCSVVPPAEFMARVFGGEMTAAGSGVLVTRLPGIMNARQPSTLMLRRLEALPEICQRRLLAALKQPAVADACRVIVHSERTLRDLLGTAELDADLVYMLSILHLALPPLRERSQDLVNLWEFRLAEHCIRHRIRRPALDRPAQEWIADHAWPGNLEEMSLSISEVMTDREDGPITARELEEKQKIWSAQLSGSLAEREQNRLRELEREALVQTLRAVKGNRRRAAKTLGVSLRTVYNMLDRHQLREAKF